MRFSGRYIKADVAFTGDRAVIINEGYDFYVQKCFDALASTSNTVYLFSLGMKRNDALAIEDSFHQAHPNYAITKRTQYIHTFSDKQKKEGMCIEFIKRIDSPLGQTDLH